MGDVVWESIKYDSTPHRSAQAVDLGTNDDGRWLFIAAGTPVSRPRGRDYDHPCDAIALIPTGGLWTATWLVGWDPALYVDVAKHERVGAERIVTMDLDVDVVRRASGEVDVLDLEEFEAHRRDLDYPPDLVRKVLRTAHELEGALRGHRAPFGSTPAPPSPPRRKTEPAPRLDRP